MSSAPERAWQLTAASSLILIALGLAANIVAARALGPDGRGVLAAIQLVATLAAELSQLGLGSAFVFGLRAYPNRAATTTLSWCMALVGLLAATITWIAGIYTGGVVGTMRATVVALAVGMALFAFLQSALQFDSSLAHYNRFRILFATGWLMSLTLLWTTATLSAATAAYTQIALLSVLSIFATAALVRVASGLARTCTATTPMSAGFLQTLRFGVSYHVTTLSGVLINNLDKVVLYFRGSTSELGAYVVAYAASRTFTMAQQSASTTLFARYAGTDEESLERATSFCFRVSFLPLLALATIIAIVSPVVVRLLFGDEYAATAPVFSVLLVESVIGGSSWLLAQRFHASGRPLVVAARQLPSLLLIVAAIPLLPDVGLPLWIALTVAGGSLARLASSLAMYRLVLRQSAPGILPKVEDFRLAWNLMRRTGARTA